MSEKSNDLGALVAKRLEELKAIVQDSKDGKNTVKSRRRYGSDFKGKCVWLMQSGLPLKDLALQSGIHPATLHKWKNEVGTTCSKGFRDEKTEGLFQVFELESGDTRQSSQDRARVHLNGKSSSCHTFH